MESVIEILYREMDAELSRSLIYDPKYQEISDEMRHICDEIKMELSMDGKKRFLMLDSYQGKMLSIESGSPFACGFRCGIQLMWELYGYVMKKSSME